MSRPAGADTERVLGGPIETNDVDLVAEPFVGWRAWQLRVSYGRPLLTSPDLNTAWTAGLNEAVCDHLTRDDREHCHCGFNAYDSREKLEAGPYIKKDVIGTIELSGEVTQYADGYRGQFAKLRELWIKAEHAEHAAALVERYGCPVHVLKAPAPAPAPQLASQQQANRVYNASRRAAARTATHTPAVDDAIERMVLALGGLAVGFGCWVWWNFTNGRLAQREVKGDISTTQFMTWLAIPALTWLALSLVALVLVHWRSSPAARHEACTNWITSAVLALVIGLLPSPVLHTFTRVEATKIRHKAHVREVAAEFEQQEAEYARAAAQGQSQT